MEDSINSQPLQATKDWRKYFSTGHLQDAETLLEKDAVNSFSCDAHSAKAMVTQDRRRYRVSILAAPEDYNAEWDGDDFTCSCRMKRTVFGREKGRRWAYSVCAHEAAVLLAWEQRRGPWVFQEPPELMERRLQKEREAREKARLQKQKEREEKEILPAGDFFAFREMDGTFYNVKRAVAQFNTNRYCVNQAAKLLEHAKIKMETPTLAYGRDGGQILRAKAGIEDQGGYRWPELGLGFWGLDSHQCHCRGYWYSGGTSQLCQHELLLLTKLQDYIEKENPGDATDKAAESFFTELDAAPEAQEQLSAAQSKEKERRFVLRPRITMDAGSAELSFKAGLKEGKEVILKSFGLFLKAVEEERAFALSRAFTVDFSQVDFTQDSLPWLQFIQRRVSETEGMNNRLQSRSYNTPTLSVQTRETLTGATLDRFYDLAEGGEYDYQDRAQGISGKIRVGHAGMRVTLSSRRVPDSGAFQGIAVSGAMPVILQGSAGSYILEPSHLSRITKEEELALRPFRKVSDRAGTISFQVGKDRLAEFYYRVIPKLLESAYVDFEDNCSGEAQPLLPPEPVFTFRLDVENAQLICEILVSYGGDTLTLREPGLGTPGAYRDGAQEARVVKAVRRYFPSYEEKSGSYRDQAGEDNLFRLLTEGLPELSRYGQVQGSDVFRRSGLRPMPQLRVGVSIDSGLMDISVLSKDLSPEELLGVLESYRQKKRYHRLKSGDFVTLAGDEQLADLEAMMEGLDLTVEDAVRGKVALPVYRALYLDSMLEQHDALASSRDRTYRALVKNFRTIRDADYEVPDAQAEILRPYQVYGYKWLRTLTAAGFGGILADEMGLGKTLQTIALIQALKAEGSAGLNLVVCPASLVFNWQEEFNRFAPELNVLPVAGTAAVRKKLLNAVKPGEPDVCITSYDLLRSDITAYEQLSFSVMVLDEAQYIKNQKAAMTKAVKVVKAEHRFALTGTPIENRLAELWSIFDYLMPGFLYHYADFSRRFETPVTKNKDEAATQRLKQMVGPFILRRLKADVLKDLPAKLEEVRYSRLEGEQRKVYDGQVVRMKQLLTQTEESDKIRIFAELTRIRQICCDPSLLFEDYKGESAKRTACLELIQSAMGGGHRMLLFSQFTSMLALLEEDLKREGIAYFIITGATPKAKRVQLVREFNEGSTPVFLISLKAGGTGLNLTGADVVIHYDPWWNLAAQNQATDRAHRIGQTNQVTVYRMIAKDTIEERILALQEAKRDLADAILSGESSSITSLSNEELLALLS